MQLFIASLNSGSNGNCYYIGNHQEAVLIDAGISCRETERRMLRLGLSMSKVKAVFVSHEHSDHIKGIAVLSRKFKLPVYITEKTRIGGNVLVDTSLLHTFSGGSDVHIGDLRISAFSKYHDAAEPHSFIVSSGDTCVGIFTDIGRVCDNLIAHFKCCDAVFMEANYDEEMLEKSSYPYFLKQRIRGGSGHLSNKQALEVFLQHKSAHLSHVLLSHLSANNNCPDKALNLFLEHAGDVHVTVASRYKESEVFAISRNKAHKPLMKSVQQVLFDIQTP